MSDTEHAGQPADLHAEGGAEVQAAPRATVENPPVAAIQAGASEAAPEPDGPVKAPPTVDHKTIELTLEEMCMRLSEERHSVELLGAFQHEEMAAKPPRLKALEADYRARFATFASRPAL